MTTHSLPRRWLAAAGVWLWQWLRRPWLAILGGIISVALSLAVWLLPQLPGQLADEPASAATWLLNTSTAYGIWGNAFLALGLFHVLRSPLLYLLLALLLPTLAAQLADQFGALRQLRQLQAYPLATPLVPGQPIPVSPIRPLFRWRGLASAAPAQVAAALDSPINRDFPNVERLEVATLREMPTGLQPEIPPVGGNSSDAQDAIETRILGMRHPRLHLLRPLLMLGLLIAVIGAWSALVFGWQVTAPPLAPGETFRSANRNLVLKYAVVNSDTLHTALEATLQGALVELPTNQATQKRVGLTTIQVRPAYPAIWLATSDGSERLMLPGESNARPSLGMVFASPGSEESILIPDERAGLRVVQRTGTNGFVLELYRSDTVQPVYRAELTEGGELTIPLSSDTSELRVTMQPGLQVDVRHLPGLWIVPLGILLALIGSIAFLRPSAFVVIQIAPWLSETTVITVQSEQPHIIAAVRAALSSLPSPSTQAANASDDMPPPTPPQAGA